MNVLKFIEALETADGSDHEFGLTVDQKKNSEVVFHFMVDGEIRSTSSILSCYLDEDSQTLNIDIGEDFGEFYAESLSEEPTQLEFDV
jgi:hypothetical protein